jgi:hypothetical protein
MEDQSNKNNNPYLFTNQAYIKTNQNTNNIEGKNKNE